jgi:hypothetical protein
MATVFLRFPAACKNHLSVTDWVKVDEGGQVLDNGQILTVRLSDASFDGHHLVELLEDRQIPLDFHVPGQADCDEYSLYVRYRNGEEVYQEVTSSTGQINLGELHQLLQRDTEESRKRDRLTVWAALESRKPLEPSLEEIAQGVMAR